MKDFVPYNRPATKGRFSASIDTGLMKQSAPRKKVIRETKRKIRRTAKWQFKIGVRKAWNEGGQDPTGPKKRATHAGKRYSRKTDALSNFIPRTVGDFPNSNHWNKFAH